MPTFYLKKRDTRPVLEVTLLEPKDNPTDADVPYDLTGATSVNLHILLEDGTALSRVMTADPDQVTNPGKATYTWLSTDWTSALVVGEHRMEYEVIGPGTVRLTFPSGRGEGVIEYDTLSIATDFGQA